MSSRTCTSPTKMFLLSPHRIFSCKHQDSKSAPSDDHSTGSSDSHSISSFGSLHSSSSSSLVQTPTMENELYPSNISHHNSNSSPNEWGIELDVYAHTDSKIDRDVCLSSPSSWLSDLSHDCHCQSRSTCPDFLQRHFTLLETNEWRRRLTGGLLTAYHISADEYAQACEALQLPAAKLRRAEAEHEWVLNHQMHSMRLRSPRLQEQLASIQKKIVAAEMECESANKRLLDRAQSLSDVGRF
ncbi:hypothetical protein K439DRAFT_1629094 [Ramaria rubella]|nr:hypothetical protein K439DRAFT_1629094 [Ramaria rubella]